MRQSRKTAVPAAVLLIRRQRAMVVSTIATDTLRRLKLNFPSAYNTPTQT